MSGLEAATAPHPETVAGWLRQAILLDRGGQHQAAAETLLKVMRAPQATPEQRLRAARLVARFEQRGLALTVATEAFEQMGRPLQWASALLYIAQRTADWDLVAALTAQMRSAYAAGQAEALRETPRTHLACLSISSADNSCRAGVVTPAAVATRTRRGWWQIIIVWLVQVRWQVTSPARGLPPILPIVLYNGLERWHAAEDIDELVRPTPPLFLRAYQPHLRYYLIDEGRYTPEQLSAIDSPLSGVFEVEIASGDRVSLQAAVDRLVRLIQADPNKARLDRLITHWLKRHLRRLSADIDLKQINSLVEDKAMLAENLESWAQRERREGRLEGERIGMKKTAQDTARNLIALGMLNDGQIAQATGLSVAQVEALRADN